jgi:hypothetical protein
MSKHTTIISSDEPVRVEVHTDGRWFRLFTALVESGTWARMSDSACRVYVALAKHCDQRWVAWPSLRTLVRLSGVKERAVCYALKELQSEGFLMRRRGGGRASTVYELLDLPATPSLPFPPAPVRDLSALHPVAPHLCTPMQSSSAPRCTRTKPVNKTQTTTAVAAAVQELAGEGVELAVAVELVERFGVAAARSAVKRAKRALGLRNRGGFIRSALERGFAGEAEAPSTELAAEALKRSARIQREASERAAAAFYASRSTQRSTEDKRTP